VAGEAKSGSGARYGAALSVLATVFFMWGFATVLNDILVPHLKAVFSLNYGQSLLIQFVFYLGYLLMSLPAAALLERIGYQPSIVAGLLGMAAAALLFVPAAMFASYGVFLVALFLLASAITLLQVAANPYVAVIGPSSSASSRLNLVQAFNSAGTTVAPIFGGILILSRSTTGTAGSEELVLTSAQRAADAQTVELPYVLIAGVLVTLAVLVWRVRMPDLAAENRRAAREERKRHSLWHHPNLVFGVPAIFIYLIAEIGIGSVRVDFLGRRHGRTLFGRFRDAQGER
jgi:FHS family L-fucose permease-like MFS transporter